MNIFWKNLFLCFFYIIFIVFAVFYIKVFWALSKRYAMDFFNKKWIEITGPFFVAILSLYVWQISFLLKNPIFEPFPYLLISYIAFLIILSLFLTQIIMHKHKKNIYTSITIVFSGIILVFQLTEIILNSLFCLSS